VKAVGNVHRRAHRRGGNPCRACGRHLVVALRLVVSEASHTVGCEFMIPHGLHIGAEPAEVIGRLVTEPADEESRV